MLSCIVALSLAQSVGTAVEYFPIVPGNQWSYQDTDNGRVNKVLDVTLPPENIGDTKVIPIESTIQGRSPERVYYKVTDDEISVCALEAGHPLSQPYPILKVPKPGQKLTWQVTSETMILDRQGPITMKGTARYLPKFLHNKRYVPAIEVTIHTDFAVTTSDKKRAYSDQVADYVRGVGLVRFRDTGTVGKLRFARIRKLLLFTPSLDPK